ncbi:undecaprenyl-phosphate 4-deoxy-4-formamido-L-arabinose transferase [Pseudomonas guariconensis]|uniref:glycosyltransferase family 2 protein n=1 Tax=Pseudomonas guariconensis TaxID=1288410 RepID=UPI00088F980C|nr:glycosyltransferase family 2 protein [Pseudomonas guariconensis]SDC54236.1 undecaprenyl-phosphate 4-deoxy-4-formamido-L-arabinose transferase [Pseudomonas guariconensis]
MLGIGAVERSEGFGISVVVPVFRSEDILLTLYERISTQLDKLTDDWELILVDDASPGRAWRVASVLYEKDARVKCVRFARNHGQQHATLCGLGYARKTYVITIDDDLQCYPEDIPLFIDQLKAGKCVVIGKIEKSEKQHHWWRNIGSRVNQRLAGRIIGKPETLALSSFRAMTLDVAKKLTAYKGAHPHIAAMIFKSVPHSLICNVVIRHAEREDGKASSYSLPKLIKTLSYLVINHSYMPLRFMIGWGVTVSILSMAYALWVLVHGLIDGYSLPGWASLAVLVSFLSGNILLALGVLGEYLGRLVEEASNIEQFSIFEEKL